MDCRECKGDLTAYLDGELPGAASERVRQHLNHCPPCRTEYEGLQESVSFVASHAPAIEPMPELWNNLRARISELPAAPRSSGLSAYFLMNRWAAAAATLAATVVLAIGLSAYYQHLDRQRKDLEEYRNAYVQMRTMQERDYIELIRETRADVPPIGIRAHLEAENPFARPPREAPNNPFKVEAR
jgi:anti-sigma factor RsiW